VLSAADVFGGCHKLPDKHLGPHMSAPIDDFKRLSLFQKGWKRLPSWGIAILGFALVWHPANMGNGILES